MKICKFCEQGNIYEVKIKKTNEIVYLCAECDALWFNDELEDKDVTNLSDFFEERDLSQTCCGEVIVIKQI